jgi:hypothetical protein
VATPTRSQTPPAAVKIHATAFLGAVRTSNSPGTSWPNPATNSHEPTSHHNSPGTRPARAFRKSSTTTAHHHRRGHHPAAAPVARSCTSDGTRCEIRGEI